jgi:hypothetical protein
VSSVRLSIELAWNGEEVIFDGVAHQPRPIQIPLNFRFSPALSA